MSWVALVPLKQEGQRKTRLAGTLAPAERHALSEQMAAHVIAALRACPRIAALHVLSPAPLPSQGWIRDHGRGLNPELADAMSRLGPVDLLILPADLPLLQQGDIEALLDAAQATGCALAPDAHGHGTNALALRRDLRIAPCFGPGSFALHRHSMLAAGATPAILRRAGLSLDIDVAGDIVAARQAGWTADLRGLDPGPVTSPIAISS